MRYFWGLFCFACTSTSKIAEPEENIVVVNDDDADGYDSEEDCDDSNPQINPGATEICDGSDNDCDEEIDEGVTDTFFSDADGDGFGNASVTIEACESPEGFVNNGNDCDDSNEETYPGAVEVCDEEDNNCDELIDEGIGGTFYIDLDGDGFGAEETEACDLRIGLSIVDGDCDDSNSMIAPGAEEICDEIDNDCDELIDEDVTLTFYLDGDEDGYGDPLQPGAFCSMIEGYIDNAQDCNDVDTLIYPGAVEICDGIDNNCDGVIDGADASDETLWYQDADEDGYGDPLQPIIACTPPTGYVASATDCNDSASNINPGMNEQCNDIDDNCDGNIDEAGVLILSTYYLDADGDGFGNANTALEDCSQPAGYVTDASDCDDQDNDVYPQAQELCNNEDDDCDGDIDESGALSFVTWYEDADGDGVGNVLVSSSECTQPEGFVSIIGDCDDSSAVSFPGATEICDEIDNDCDGVIDNNLIFGSEATCPGLDCADILLEEPSLEGLDGVYWIDPEGNNPFEAYCDMTSDGGGWTLLGSIYGGDGNNWNTKFGYWSNTSTLGSVATPFQDFKSSSWNVLDISTADVLWTRRYDGIVKAKVILDNTCQGGKQLFRDIFTSWDTSINCGLSAIEVIQAPTDSVGVSTSYYQEGTNSSYAYGLGSSGTNGWCWNGGDSANNTFQGHAGWNQLSYGCYDAGHLSYIAVFANYTSQYSGVDIDTTNWLYSTTSSDRSKTSISFFAR